MNPLGRVLESAARWERWKRGEIHLPDDGDALLDAVLELLDKNEKLSACLDEAEEALDSLRSICIPPDDVSGRYMYDQAVATLAKIRTIDTPDGSDGPSKDHKQRIRNSP